MRIYFFRHGKTPGNEKKQYIGITDESLSTKGIEELNNNKLYLNAQLSGIEKVFVSPMKRCIETASIYFPDSEKIIVKGLKEMDFGIFEAKNYIDLADSKEYREWVDSMCEAEIPGGEKKSDFQERVVKAFLGIIAEQNTDQVVFIVHGGTIMALFDYFTNHEREYYQWYINNGSYYSAEWDGKQLTDITCFDEDKGVKNA